VKNVVEQQKGRERGGAGHARATRHDLQRRAIVALVASISVSACAAAVPLRAQTPSGAELNRVAPPIQGARPSAVERMQELGPEDQELARRTGAWDVVSTLRLTPDAPPMVSRSLIAERKMVGAYLEEIMKPAPGSDAPDFRRICYLTYFRVEGRWQYVSLDTRFPVGIMPAYSFDKGGDRELTLQFEPLGFVGFGPDVEGRMVRSNLVIKRDTDDHELSQQNWIEADGSGREWLAVQYEYTRRR
jgi:hypothetical protein